MDNLSNVFIGRQPILDREKRTFAYELLYRTGKENIFPDISGPQATIQLIENAFCNLGIENIAGGKAAFINFSKSLLLSDLTYLNPRRVVIEVLEDVSVDEEIINVVNVLKTNGFRIALDDFVWTDEFGPLIPLADFIKVDWLASSINEIERICKNLSCTTTRLIAEKIETDDHFKAAYDLGFDYFQGFFFARPTILKGKNVRPARKTRLRIMAAINHTDMDMEKIYALLSRDPALAIKVLRLVNSASFGISEKISSIMQAVSLLGERKLKQWLAIIFLSSITRGTSEALFNASVVRACFAEKIAVETGRPELGSPAFMAGLLSMVEGLFNIPVETVLSGLSLEKDIIDVLIFQKGPIYPVIVLAEACERANMPVIEGFSSRTGVSMTRIGDLWLDAIKWAVDSTLSLTAA